MLRSSSMMSNTAEEVTPHAAQQVFVAQSTTSQEPLCDLERARLISPSCHLSFEEQDAPCSSLSSLQLPLRKSSSAGDLTSAENSTACLDVDSEELLVWVNSVIKSYKLQVNNLDERYLAAYPPSPPLPPPKIKPHNTHTHK